MTKCQNNDIFYLMKQRIGEHFIGLNLLSLEQCEEVLKIQTDDPKKKFGEIAISLGFLEEADISEYFLSY